MAEHKDVFVLCSLPSDVRRDARKLLKAHSFAGRELCKLDSRRLDGEDSDAEEPEFIYL